MDGTHWIERDHVVPAPETGDWQKHFADHDLLSVARLPPVLACQRDCTPCRNRCAYPALVGMAYRIEQTTPCESNTGLVMHWATVFGMLTVIGAAFGIVAGITRAARWYAGRCDHVDALIAKAGARYRAGLEKADPQKVDRAGERRWQQALQGQRRLRKRPQTGHMAANVQPFRKARHG